MPWAHALLRGQKVLARVRADRAFDASGGRVEIRYRPTDSRAYHAATRNLELLASEPLVPDDAVVPAAEPPPATSNETTKAKTKAQGSAKTSRSRTSASAGGAVDASRSPAPVPAGAWTVYADGACSGNPGPAGLGIVLVGPDGVASEGYQYLGEATNNIAELTAILRAAEILPSGALAVVHTDSQYAIGVLTKGWKAKANQDLIARVKKSLEARRGWRFVHVRGHAGVPLNERADELAREAVTTRASRLPNFAG